MIKQEKFFLEALETNDVKKIREAICLYIDKDATDSNGELKQAIEITKQRGINIWESHKEIESVKPKSEWNEFYLGVLQGDLKYNFSKERLSLILEIANHIYSNEKYVKKAKLNQEQSPTITHKKPNSSSTNKTVRHETGSFISQETSPQRDYPTLINEPIKKQLKATNIKYNPSLSTDLQKNVHKKYETKSKEMKQIQEMKRKQLQNKDLIIPLILGAGVAGLITAAYFISSK